MRILIIGGTRFFGIHTVNELIRKGHKVTIATRGVHKDNFGDLVSRIIVDRGDIDSVKKSLAGKHYDVIIDKIAYCSNDIRNILDVVECDKYVYMSSSSVYKHLHKNIREEEFDEFKEKFVWCDREDYSYDVVKRQAEYVLAQKYGEKNIVLVRYPVVLGKDDYTERLKFYIKNVINEIPMYIDNYENRMSFINSEEAGKFMAFIVEKDFVGAINGASIGAISIKEIIDYVEKKTGKKAILEDNGEVAPYNETPEYSINVTKANKLGYTFSNINDWIYDLIDYYIENN